jgi:hypothetical protein
MFHLRREEKVPHTLTEGLPPFLRFHQDPPINKFEIRMLKSETNFATKKSGKSKMSNPKEAGRILRILVLVIRIVSNFGISCFEIVLAVNPLRNFCLFTF